MKWLPHSLALLSAAWRLCSAAEAECDALGECRAKEEKAMFIPRDVSTFYQKPAGSLQAKRMELPGFYAVFHNMSPVPVQLYYDALWEGIKHLTDIKPFSAAGATMYPAMRVLLMRQGLDVNTDSPLTEWDTETWQANYYFDPGMPNKKRHEAVYKAMKENQQFAKRYKETTGTEWLLPFSTKGPPRYDLWPADYIGQTHRVLPGPEDEPDEGELVLKVLSCAPRVFEISNFLTQYEMNHLIMQAEEKREAAELEDEYATLVVKLETQSTSSSWVGVGESPTTQTIFDRMGRALQIPSSRMHNFQKGIAEPILMQQYIEAEPFTDLHDFAVPEDDQSQTARFATIKIFLSDVEEGGELTFPIWKNAETSQALRIKPEKGKAILYYNVLPDGNFDALALNGGVKIRKGRLELATLWVWDPILREDLVLDYDMFDGEDPNDTPSGKRATPKAEPVPKDDSEFLGELDLGEFVIR